MSKKKFCIITGVTAAIIAVCVGIVKCIDNNQQYNVLGRSADDFQENDDLFQE